MHLSCACPVHYGQPEPTAQRVLSPGQPIRPDSRECTSSRRSERNFSARLRQRRFGGVRPVRGVVRTADAALAVTAKAGRLGAPAIRRRALDVVGVDTEHEPRVARLLDLDAAEPQLRSALTLARDARLPRAALRGCRAGFIVGRRLLRCRPGPDDNADRIRGTGLW